MCPGDNVVDDHSVCLNFIPENKSVLGLVDQSSTAIQRGADQQMRVILSRSTRRVMQM